MNSILIAILTFVGFWLIIRSVNTHLKQQKLLRVREMLHTERVKSLESNVEPIDINFEMETIEQMMSQSITTSTTFMRIWHQISFRLAVFFIAISLMGLLLISIAFLSGIEIRHGMLNVSIAPLLIGVPLLLTNLISSRYLK